MMPDHQPARKVRSRVFDSERWHGYTPRNDDIVIGTYSKCGTTWMQRIVSMLVFKTAEPMHIWDLSPWPDMRLFGPIEATIATAEAQTHRRFFKTHMPYDALPHPDGVKFIHVARDGRDAALSFHNHLSNFTPETLAHLDEISLNDPKFGDPCPRAEEDPADFFHSWVTDEGRDGQGDTGASFFGVEKSYWAARHDPNLLLVHYADLKQDRGREMRQVAEFLDIEIPEPLWPSLVEAASFETMRRQGAGLIPALQKLWGDGGSDRFFNKGINRRWEGVFRPADLALYDTKVQSAFEPELAHWIEHGGSFLSQAQETKTEVTEIAPGIYRFSTHVAEVAAPHGFGFNQFLIMADEPLLFHCGPRAMFPLVSAALQSILPVEQLRWISFGHIEADECGAMNLWLNAAPNAQIIYSELGCMVSVNDLADRPPRSLAEGEVLDLGGRRIRLIATPHVPHGWEAQVLFEETTGTLFCGDLFTHVGQVEPLTRESIVESAMIAEELFHATSLGPSTAPTIRRLAELAPSRLAVMHGSSFEGDGAQQLHQLADRYENLLETATGLKAEY